MSVFVTKQYCIRGPLRGVLLFPHAKVSRCSFDFGQGLTQLQSQVN